MYKNLQFSSKIYLCCGINKQTVEPALTTCFLRWMCKISELQFHKPPGKVGGTTQAQTVWHPIDLKKHLKEKFYFCFFLKLLDHTDFHFFKKA